MDNQNNNGKKTYFYVAIVLAALGAVALGVSFTKLGLYALIASMIFEVAAVTLANMQKRIKDLKWLLHVKIAAYVLFVAALFFAFI